MIAIVVAMARRNVIGRDGKMPWGKLPADLKFFRELTTGHTVVMGRKTFESIGHPLSGRINIVMTHQKLEIPGCVVRDTLGNILLEGDESRSMFVIGGGDIYKQAMHFANRLYVTLVNEFCDGDTFFPEIDPFTWREISSVPGGGDEKNPHQFCRVVFERRVFK